MTFVTATSQVIVVQYVGCWLAVENASWWGRELRGGEGRLARREEENLNVQRISWKLLEDQQQQSI